MLIDSDVDASLAADNILTLTTGDLKIIGMEYSHTISEGAPDAGATALLDKFFADLPPEIGGLEGLQSILTLMILLTGMAALEAVPGEPLTGLTRAWPVDPLSLLLTRPDKSADVEVRQKQVNFLGGEKDDPLYPGYILLNPERFFWKPYQPIVDDPYGRPSFGPAISEILCMIHMLQALRDCIDHTAWPRGVVEVDTEGLYNIAVQQMGFIDTPTDPAATNWVLTQFANFTSTMKQVKSDDWIVMGAGSKTVMMQGGTFAGLDAMIKNLQSRIVRGLKQMPVMMGSSEGSTEGHTSVQWQVYARRLEMVRAAALVPILKAANLHFRLLGLPFVAVAKFQPIRTTDALVEAQTEAMRLKNEAIKMLLRWSNNDSSCLAITGNAPATAAPDLPTLTAEEAKEVLMLVAGMPPPLTGNAGGGAPIGGGDNTAQDNAEAKAT